MSLLSGIKFIPKEKRTISEDVKSKKDDSKKHDRREKPDKHDRRHKSSKHKSKKSSRERESERDRRNYDSDSSSSIDMMQIAKEEEQRERNERYTNNDNTRSSREHYKDNNEDVTTKKFDPNHFRSLIDSLKRPSTVSEEKIEDVTDIDYNHQNNNDDDYHSTINNSTVDIQVHEPIVPSTTVSTVNTNQSAAAMLRDRLKSSKSHLKIPTGSVQPVSSGDSNFKSNIDIDRDIIALKNRLNDKREGQSIETASITNQKKRKSNLPQQDEDIHTLKYHEKTETENMDDIYRDNILRLGGRYKGTENSTKGAYGNGDRAGMDEENDIDMKMFEKKERNNKDNIQYEAQKVMKSQQYLRKIVETCYYCTESKKFQLNNILSMGENVYIRVKLDPTVLITGHLEIIPISHISSILQCDEETLIEIERYQLCLKRMYEELNQSVLFIETAVHFNNKPHAHIDVIPIEIGMEAEASMFFKEVSDYLTIWIYFPNILYIIVLLCFSFNYNNFIYFIYFIDVSI